MTVSKLIFFVEKVLSDKNLLQKRPTVKILIDYQSLKYESKYSHHQGYTTTK